ncbi:MAG TPA: aminotransferase class V-fold PLP-dependent enzyme, partial [Thermoanaerobaculia bacterium]
TEANNLAILGAAHALKSKGNRIVTGQTEHRAVLDACKALEAEGLEVVALPPDAEGRISADQVRGAIQEGTTLVSLMLANNEIGTIHPIAEIGAVCRERGVLLHCDAVQGFTKIAFDVGDFQVDLASVTAHKLYGPKGIGALYVRARHPRVRLMPQIHGGGHERGLRSGTLNVPGIVGFGRAVEIAMADRAAEARRLRRLRARLWQGISSRLDGLRLNGPELPPITAKGDLADAAPERRLPGNLNVSFAGVEGEALLMSMRDAAVSSGSACTSASLQPSHVLRAIGVADELAHASIRYGLGRGTTEEEVDFAADTTVSAVEKLRALMPPGAATAR